jgi:hypothetical protein
MGGFTSIKLIDCSEDNIKKQNELLKENGVCRKYRFYSEEDIQFEYNAFVKNVGSFPDHLFPKDKIKSYEDFKKYWSPEALGEIFVPYNGMLKFDCYFNRTSKRAMNKIAGYLLCNFSQIKSVDGSYSTFVERSGWGKARQKELMTLD